MTRLSTSLKSSLLALAAAVLLPSCESSKKEAGYDDVVDYTTPKTNLSKEEYPFDEDGNYLEKYAARGAGTADNKPRDTPADTAMYSQPADDTPERSPVSTSESYTPRKSTSTASRSSSSGSRSSASRSSSGSRNTASRSSSKSKPKPKPKPSAPKPSLVKVKPGDTLYGLAARHGTTVAAIKSANGLSSDTIRDGKTLKIPPKKKK